MQDNSQIRSDTPFYQPYIRFPNTDIISWNFGTEEKPDWAERAIRYLPGFASIFVDEQEANGREVPKNLLENPFRFEIIDGDIKVRPTEKTKLQFLDMCNRNSDSPHRTGRLPFIFSRYSEDAHVDKMAENQKFVADAIQKAMSASEDQIAFHAKYLGISMIDAATQATRTLKAIRTDYQQAAIDNPKQFIATFDDADLKMKYFIERAIEDNTISLTLIPGKAVWTGSKEEICDIPAGTTAQDALFNFSQLTAGEAMAKRLKG